MADGKKKPDRLGWDTKHPDSKIQANAQAIAAAAEARKSGNGKGGR